MRKALAHLKKNDPVLRDLIDRLGPYRIEYAPADFATLVRCIVNQQLSGKVARTIYERLAAAPGGGGLSPESILELTAERMRALGLSHQKISYIRDLAERCRCGSIDVAALKAATDLEVMKQLTTVKGIGPWTVHMVLIFALRRPDVLPTGDLGIRVAIQRAYKLESLPTPAEMERIAIPWRPYASVASWYLWRSLGDGVGM